MTDEREDAATVCNPRYEGATPEMVGRALLRHSELAPKQRAKEDEDQETSAA